MCYANKVYYYYNKILLIPTASSLNFATLVTDQRFMDVFTDAWSVRIGVGEEGETSQSEDVCAVFPSASTTALVTFLDVTQNLQEAQHPAAVS